MCGAIRSCLAMPPSPILADMHIRPCSPHSACGMACPQRRVLCALVSTPSLPTPNVPTTGVHPHAALPEPSGWLERARPARHTARRTTRAAAAAAVTTAAAVTARLRLGSREGWDAQPRQLAWQLARRGRRGRRRKHRDGTVGRGAFVGGDAGASQILGGTRLGR